jgi:hypothetical protein
MSWPGMTCPPLSSRHRYPAAHLPLLHRTLARRCLESHPSRAAICPAFPSCRLLHHRVRRRCLFHPALPLLPHREVLLPLPPRVGLPLPNLVRIPVQLPLLVRRLLDGVAPPCRPRRRRPRHSQRRLLSPAEPTTTYLCRLPAHLGRQQQLLQRPSAIATTDFLSGAAAAFNIHPTNRIRSSSSSSSN